jgi:GT2 family glycosyltransferase
MTAFEVASPTARDGSLTVGICSRNRPDSLARCLRSLALLEGAVARVIVVDDGSEPPLEAPVRAELGAALPARITFVHQDSGLAAGRNRIVRDAATEWVLCLDDDTFITTRAALDRAITLMEADVRVSAIAFAQTDAAGKPWPAGAQPAPVPYPCWVRSFIGYAHLVRRAAFQAVGGFAEYLRNTGEEKELCMRLFAAGGGVVYLPDAGIAHLADSRGRDMRRYLQRTTRNDVLSAVRNDPLPVLAVMIPFRLLGYFRMRKGWKVHDPGGFGALLRAIAAEVPSAVGARSPLPMAVWRRWRRLKFHPPYRPPNTIGSVRPGPKPQPTT